jgi:putative phosphoribosyl transferase
MSRGIQFRNRRDAGRQLAELLRPLADRPGVLVLGLPRGGVPVAYEVARLLHAPLDVLAVRKLGVPGHEEYAMGAIATGGVQLLDRRTIHDLRIPAEEVKRVVETEQRELERREREYRGARPALDVLNHTVILVDDGLATGSTMAAAVAAVRQQGPAAVVVAAPVGSAATCSALQRVADVSVCARTPEPFYGVGQWYRDFEPTTDEEVRTLLHTPTTGREARARETSMTG